MIDLGSTLVYCDTNRTIFSLFPPDVTKLAGRAGGFIETDKGTELAANVSPCLPPLPAHTDLFGGSPRHRCSSPLIKPRFHSPAM